MPPFPTYSSHASLYRTVKYERLRAITWERGAWSRSPYHRFGKHSAQKTIYNWMGAQPQPILTIFGPGLQKEIYFWVRPYSYLSRVAGSWRLNRLAWSLVCGRSQCRHGWTFVREGEKCRSCKWPDAVGARARRGQSRNTAPGTRPTPHAWDAGTSCTWSRRSSGTDRCDSAAETPVRTRRLTLTYHHIIIIIIIIIIFV